ncbi:hypothetical protein MNBD_ACTINO02-525, partial [hydrothermal vent metagenome]
MSVVGAVERLMEQERLGCAITVVNGPDIGQKAVVDIEEGVVAGALPDNIAA